MIHEGSLLSSFFHLIYLLVPFSDFEPVELTACQMMRQQILGRSSGNATVGRVLPGQFVPNCSPDGHFEIVQCHGSTGHCWCVGQLDGREVTGSRRRAPLRPSCSSTGNPSFVNFSLFCNMYNNNQRCNCYLQRLNVRFICFVQDLIFPVFH